MAAGFPLNRNEIDQRAGRVVTAVRDALAEAAGFNAALQDTTVLGTTADQPPVDLLVQAGGYTVAEAAQLRNGIFALALVGMVAHGQAAQPGAQPSDFFFDAKHLAGARW